MPNATHFRLYQQRINARLTNAGAAGPNTLPIKAGFKGCAKGNSLRLNMNRPCGGGADYRPPAPAAPAIIGHGGAHRLIFHDKTGAAHRIVLILHQNIGIGHAYAFRRSMAALFVQFPLARLDLCEDAKPPGWAVGRGEDQREYQDDPARAHTPAARIGNLVAQNAQSTVMMPSSSAMAACSAGGNLASTPAM